MSAGEDTVAQQGRQDMVDPLYAAALYMRRRQFDNCIEVCSAYLERSPFDQAVWYLKTRALTEKVHIDETELEEEGMGDALMDDNTVADMPRPTTSVRPMTSGFARPATASRPVTSGEAFRPGTSRPVTSSSGRFVRLGTASLVAEPGGPFIKIDKLDFRKYAQRPALAVALYGYILHVEINVVKALELATLAHQYASGKSWWWKNQIAHCFYLLNLYRDAEPFFRSSLRDQDMAVTYLLRGKIYHRLKQPPAALDNYMKGLEAHPNHVGLLTAVARTHAELGDDDRSIAGYKAVLAQNACSAEAIACLGAARFYKDQPEIALQYYRRLLQTGQSTVEVWNNIGLCCFYAQQYDMALGCFDRALALASDLTSADVWYNISHVAVAVGDIDLAFQALKLCVASDSNHAEAYNNLGVIELFRGNAEQAKSEFVTAAQMNGALYEPAFNSGLLNYKMGDFQESYGRMRRAHEIQPQQAQAKHVISLLQKHFALS